MLFCINTVHSGFMGGFVAFCLFSLPGAIGMYILSIGVSKIGNTLPDPVYALLSGLSAGTVGIIALAAVRLASRAITDRLTRFLVYLGGAMGMLYTALWYYPVLMASSGFATLVWDMGWLQLLYDACSTLVQNIRSSKKETLSELEKGGHSSDWTSWKGSQKPLPPTPKNSSRNSISSEETIFHRPFPCAPPPSPELNAKSAAIAKSKSFSSMSWQLGTSIIGVFLAIFTLTIALHAATHNPSRSFSLFSSLCTWFLTSPCSIDGNANSGIHVRSCWNYYLWGRPGRGPVAKGVYNKLGISAGFPSRYLLISFY